VGGTKKRNPEEGRQGELVGEIKRQAARFKRRKGGVWMTILQSTTDGRKNSACIFRGGEGVRSIKEKCIIDSDVDYSQIKGVVGGRINSVSIKVSDLKKLRNYRAVLAPTRGGRNTAIRKGID